MTEQPDPVGSPAIRASDAERELVATALHEALSRGQLDLTETEERLAAVYRSRTRLELAQFTADLGVDPLAGLSGSPVSPLRPGGYGPPAAPPVDLTKPEPGGIVRAGSQGRSRGVAILSGVAVTGSWTIAETFDAIAFWGGVDLDLRDATFAAPEVTIRVSLVMGGMKIVVGEDTEVIVDGVGIMGAFDNRAGSPSHPVTRRVRLTGFALMAGVEVQRRPRIARSL